jgi:alanine dehydrogenase
MTESWRSRKTLILGRTDMMGLLSPAEYVDRVEHAFRMHGLGRVYMEPKGHIVLDRYKGEWEVMPSYIEEPEAAACKWVSIREDNAKYDLPAVFSILIYTHPETGFPLAICDGSFHTLMRTGASAAVSAKWLQSYLDEYAWRYNHQEHSRRERGVRRVPVGEAKFRLLLDRACLPG